MKNGHDHHDEASNVVSLAGARKHAKAAAKTRNGRGSDKRRVTPGQWLTSGLFVVLAIGGVFALTVPLLRAAGILGD